jgi:hypothetical protein
MKALLGALTVAVVLLAQPAAGAPWDFRPGLQSRERQAPGPREAQRERRAVPERSERRQDRPDRQGRLTEEERRDLRRDVDRANRELYRNRPER